jgi:uncharacterized protein (TIGR02145 family)
MKKNRKLLLYSMALIGFSLMLTFNCKKDEKKSVPDFPTVATNEYSNITINSVVCGGNVTADGGATVSAKGVCWGTNDHPTISDNKSNDGSGTGSFTSNITNLTPNTVYYMRAYATNSTGTAYGDQVKFSTKPQLTPCSCGSTVNDIEGNIYEIVQIGSQCWMAENLKTTKYNDGSSIPFIRDSAAWGALTTPAYCWFNNNEFTNKRTFGALYNWYALSGNNGKNPCPLGWHVPSKADWDILTGYLGGPEIAGGKLKEVGTMHWGEPNTGATNESGFTALPGSYRNIQGGWGPPVGNEGNWWSTSLFQYDSTFAFGVEMDYFGGAAGGLIHYNIKSGFSCRCVKD